MNIQQFMVELDIYYYLVLKNMMSMTTELNISKRPKVVLQIFFYKYYASIKTDLHTSLLIEKNIDFACY